MNTGAPIALYYMYSNWCELMQKLLVVGKCKHSSGEETLRLNVVDIYMYISDIPLTTSRQYGYADDFALLHSDRAWSNVENTLTADMSLIAKYLRTWRLKLSMAKTTATAFHLNTKEANRQLTITLDGTPLPYNATPTYLGVKLDRQLTYKEHLKSIRAKVSSFAVSQAQSGVPVLPLFVLVL